MKPSLKSLARFALILIGSCAPISSWAQQGATSAAQPTAAPPAQQDAAAPAQPDQVMTAVLQGLDKVTARISTFAAPLGRTVKFGTLEIVARSCRKRPPEEPPESAAFLEIQDIRRDEEPKALFSGWMFASSPALSALEHPVYDVWVIDCKYASSSESARSQ